MGSNPDQPLDKLEKRLGVKFKNHDLLRQALIHRSYLNENKDCILSHNERLEFLGDAVLEFVVTEYLYNARDEDEGVMTNWRASLVNTHTLAKLAQELDLNASIMLSKGELKDPSSKARQYILADAVEAVIGAIYLDQGLNKAKKFVAKHILKKLDEIIEKKLYIDPKTKFQEKAQSVYGVTPIYRVLEESGPDHAKVFKVGLYLGKELVVTGHGSSKQEAQVDAADKGVKMKKW